jgi:RNA polymerase sigma-70 factor (ECF subfamily)
MPADQRSDDELLKASVHDAEAFAVFYRRHAEAVLVYLRQRTTDVETAADLTADVFAGAFASRKRFKPRQEPARAWLFGIANNLLAMSRRKHGRALAARAKLGIPRIEFQDEELERADARLTALMEGDPLNALVADLPAEQREAVLARVVHERDYDEIAREQDVSEALVRQRVSRGLARLSGGLREGRQQ